MAPLSAAMVAPALRNPCAEQCGSPASSQRSRNQLEVDGRAGEVWRLTTDLVQAAGYLPGDCVVVDRDQAPRPQDVVLAELRESAGPGTPIFRAYLPPYLMVVNPSASLQSPLLVDNVHVAVIGPIVASVRTRDG